MLDYDREAATYDETRGGLPRARAAATAVRELLPPTTRTLLDLGCGTGTVSWELAGQGLKILGVDASRGMVRLAASRGVHVAVGEGGNLPLADQAVDAVSAVWLLHLLPDARPVIAECARVLRHGGVFVTTVDKNAGSDDIDPLLAPFRRPQQDRTDLIVAEAARHGLRPAGESTFVGHGQGRSPRQVIEDVRAARHLSESVEKLVAALGTLPGQETARPDPVFRLLALRR